MAVLVGENEIVLVPKEEPEQDLSQSPLEHEDNDEKTLPTEERFKKNLLGVTRNLLRGHQEPCQPGQTGPPPSLCLLLV